MSDGDHWCKQEPRLIRLEIDAGKAEAERRTLRQDIMDKMDLIRDEVVGMAQSSKAIVDDLRTEVDQLRARLAEVDDTIDRRTKAAFARIDELRDLLGAEGHS